MRVDWKTISHAGPVNHDRQINTRRGVSTSFRLDRAAHRLELTVGPDGLKTVALDERVLPGLSVAGVGNPPPQADYKGKFGVYVYTGNGIFRDARYRFHEEP